MGKKISDTYDLKLELLLPIHIGTGEVYTSLDYVVNEEKFIVINKSKFIERLSSDQSNFGKFLDFIKRGNLVGLRGFFRREVKETDAMYVVEADEEFRKKYVETIENYSDPVNKIINKLEVNRIFRNPFTYEPFIPGSSIKGAIRTALVYYSIRKSEKSIQELKKKKSYDEIESLVLGYKDPADDPLKCIRISDFTKKVGEEYVDIVVNIKDLASEERKVPQQLELIRAGSMYTGKIQIVKNLRGCRYRMEEVVESVNRFYKEVYEFEREKYYSGASIEGLDFDDSGKFFLKLGFHSGAYSKSLPGLRKIRVKTKEGVRVLDHQTTTWVTATENAPLGWVKLEIL